MPLSIDQIKDIHNSLKQGCKDLSNSLLPGEREWDKEIKVFKGLVETLGSSIKCHNSDEKEQEKITSLNNLLDETIDQWKKIKIKWSSESNLFVDAAINKYTNYLRTNCAELCNEAKHQEAKLIVSESKLRHENDAKEEILRLQGKDASQQAQIENLRESNAKLNIEIGRYDSMLKMIIDVTHNKELDDKTLRLMLISMTLGLHKKMSQSQTPPNQATNSAAFFTNPTGSNSSTADQKTSAKFSAA